MNEILSVIKLKDKVTIISLMLTFAALLGASIGVVTQATVDPHQHNYVYHIERGEDGYFDYVGVCSDEECEDPRYVQNISSGVYETVTLQPSCSAEGEKEYSFTYGGKTYTLTEKIPVIDHSYFGDIVVEDGKTTITADCTLDGCTSSKLSVSLPNELEPKIEEATCHSPRYERYSFTHNGETITVTKVTEEEIPHTLNGVYISEFELYEGVYKYGTKGIVTLGSIPLLCGEKTLGCYICEECKETVSVTVGKAEHNYVYDESKTVLSDTTKDGSAIVKCINDDCTDVLTITIPKIVEGENAELVEANHLDKYKKLKYSFVNAEYGITIEFETTVVWNVHDYVLLEDRTQKPSLDRPGRIYVGCAYEGCEEVKAHSIPKIIIGENATVITDASELTPTIVLYTYVSESYGFTLTLELSIGSALNHEYKYTFEREGDGFVIIGRCDQPGCQTPVTRDENLEISFVDTSTCFKLGNKVWTCIHNGVEYTYTEAATEYPSHNFVYKESETVNPDFVNAGRAFIRCDNEGCTKYQEFTLPKIVVGTNAIITDTNPVTGEKVIKYVYRVPSYNITIEIDYNTPPHTHNYEYSLEPGSSPLTFDLIGNCYGWDCDAPVVREENVKTSFVNTSTCVYIGESIWSYVKDGVTYEFRLPDIDYGRHVYTYDEENLTKPGFDAEGYVDVVCSVEECGHATRLTLPKVVIGVNTESVSADPDTGLRVLRYTVNVSGMLVELEYRVTEHIHVYEYILEANNGGFDLVGSCSGSFGECNAPLVREENVETSFETTSTCTTLGEDIWSYVKDGVTYTVTLPSTEYLAHNYVYIEEDITRPSFDADGYIIMMCINEGNNHTDEFVLPKLVMNENSTTVSFDQENGIRVIKYSVTVGGVNVELEFEIIDNHTHEYEYALEPSSYFGKFDFIARCTNERCGDEIREHDVPVTLVEDSVSCVAPGVQVWEHYRDDKTYQCVIRFDVFFGHDYCYDPAAATTVKPDFNNTGSIYVYCNACDDVSLVVELPVMVLDNNTVFVKETDYEIVYLYTHIAENGEDRIEISLIISFTK